MDTIDVALNRALVYTLLTAFVAGMYAAGVGVVALLGQSVGVNRFLYGERDEPYTVIGRIASCLEAAGSAQQLLPGLVEAVATALRVPWTALEMCAEDGSTRRIAHGSPAPGGVAPSSPCPRRRTGT
ncbi:hypothetical protein [Streptomyces fulvoviolaceus]|uniref:hypothetical protein n=1 Tax=Streptomyces fulvoviolaceus TaxID=285535 RepID=UPI0004C9CD4A|nr:hypothetical protein [Streptomyces fulvoviolaceus]MCT9082487.1 hypothetical protein [Streptomyces fulvoviolaceus]